MDRSFADRLIARGDCDLSDILADVRQLQASEDSYDRSAAALALGKKFERERLPILLEMLEDSELYVKGDAVTAMGELKDSRALFHLFSAYGSAPVELKKRILDSMRSDPRAEGFLTAVNDTELKPIAQKAISFCNSNSSYFYTFCGRPEMHKKALQNKEFYEINSPFDLDRIEHILTDESFQNHPQTYVVTLDGKLRVGGWVEEHVMVAQGREVLVAGEIMFEKNPEWRAVFANNRSFGYLPHSSGLHWLKQALDDAGIVYDEPTPFEPDQGWENPEFYEHFMSP